MDSDECRVFFLCFGQAVLSSLLFVVPGSLLQIAVVLDQSLSLSFQIQWIEVTLVPV
jgi:hypothetical protein